MSKTIKRRDLSLTPHSHDLASVHPVLQRIYQARSVTSLKDIDYRLGGLLAPEGMAGLGTAVDLLINAIKTDQRVVVVGDFDADGATSSALAVLALRAMGLHDVDYLVPNRFDYGYGLTPEIVEVAWQSKPDLIVTVDNGVSSIEGVKRANHLGMQVIVTDHHLPGEQLPAAAALVNPNQPGCAFPSQALAGVGVIFYVMLALRARLRQQGWFEEAGFHEPNMAEFLDLVALGTVADLVPLDSNNRTLVYQGLQRIASGRARPGIAALLEVAGRQAQRACAADLGFIVGPRLNAAGRLDDISLGIRCLLTTDLHEARQLAQQLNDLNNDRRTIEAAMQREALAILEQMEDQATEDSPWGLCLYQEQWHQGVVGIVASRVKERFHRPVIVFADADNGDIIKGSARSIAGLHIRDTLDMVATENPNLIVKFGGHAMAAGLSIQRGDLDRFAQCFDRAVRRQLSADQLEQVVLSDGVLQAEDFNLGLAEAIRAAGPWGQRFPEPLFDGQFRLIQQRIVGGKHLKMVVAPKSCDNLVLDAIAFSVDLDIWPNEDTEWVQLAYQLEVNSYRGRESLQLLVRDFWPVLI